MQVIKRKTLKIIDKSIAHHEAELEKADVTLPKYGPASCSLCVKFIKNKCAACPVAVYTNKTLCDGTPYEALLRKSRIMRAFFTEQNQLNYQEAAKEEINFLKRVRVWFVAKHKLKD